MRLDEMEKYRVFNSWAIEPLNTGEKRPIVMGAEVNSVAVAYYCGLVQRVCPETAQQVISSVSLKQAVRTAQKAVEVYGIKHDSLLLQGCLMSALRDQAITESELEQMVVEIDRRATDSDLIIGLHFASVRDCIIRVINRFVPDKAICILSNGRFDETYLKTIQREINLNEVGFINVLSKDHFAQEISNWALERRLVCQYHYGGGERILRDELAQVAKLSGSIVQFGEPRTEKGRSFMREQLERGVPVGVVDRRGLTWAGLALRGSKPKLVKKRNFVETPRDHSPISNGELF